jgi:hypothetical protein
MELNLKPYLPVDTAKRVVSLCPRSACLFHLNLRKKEVLSESPQLIELNLSGNKEDKLKAVSLELWRRP